MNKLVLIGITVIMFFFKNSSSANYENIFYDFKINNVVGKIINSVGTVKGIISKKKIGKNGFGYDPIFIPFGKKITFGQMKPSLKYKIDHRYKAFKKIKRFF